MVSLICIGCKSTSCSLDPDLTYQSIHHQFLIQSNGEKIHLFIKIMSYRVIYTLNCWRCAWYSALNNIDVSMKIWTVPVLLLHWRNFKKIFDESQSNLSDRRIFWHSWSLLSVGVCVTIPQFDPSIVIGANRSSDASIPSFLCGLVGSSHTWIPHFQYCFGFISDFSIIFTDHKPYPNSGITTSPESSVNTVTPLRIISLICSTYSGRNGDTVNSFKVNDIDPNLAFKKGYQHDCSFQWTMPSKWPCPDFYLLY